MKDEVHETCNMCGRDEKHKILLLKPKGKRPLWIYRYRWQNIAQDLE